MEDVKSFEIPLNPYRITLCVAIGETDCGIDKYVEKANGEMLHCGIGCYAGYVSSESLLIKRNKQTAILMWLKSNPNYGTIAHETYHVVKRLYKLIHSDGTEEEPFAYMIGFIVNEIVKNISSTNK